MTEEKPSLFDLHIEPETGDSLRDGAKWARLLAILGFIGIGLFLLSVILGFFTASRYSALGGSSQVMMIMIMEAVVLALYFIPTLFLFRFGKNTISALDNTDQDSLNTGIANLKSCFKFLGIMAIVGYGIMALAIIVVIITVISR